MMTDPATGEQEIAGAVRLVIGRERRSDRDPEPIDAMNFVRPTGDWPHRLSGRSDAEICELGRFVIPEKFRTSAMWKSGADTHITGSLVREARRIAKQAGASVMYALMPVRVAELNARGGVGLQRLAMSLRTDDSHVAEIFEAFSVYWCDSSPDLYVMKLAAAEMAEVFRAALPADRVIDDAVTLQRRYGRNVTALERQIPLVLRPVNEEEVARIVCRSRRRRRSRRATGAAVA
jgi:hypothetical protein